MESRREADVVIVGGGLTGITAALRLAQGGASVVVVDLPLPEAEGRIGGFARFSGAKFSLPPAGMGLLPVAGSKERFDTTIDSVLSMLKMDRSMTQPSVDLREHDDLTLRSYGSIVLTPGQITELLDALSVRLGLVACLVQGCVTGIRPAAQRWVVEVSEPSGNLEISANAVFYAAGRLSNDLLLNLGAHPVEGKGLDVGIRLEFLDKEALSKLRSLGPDAKILRGNCRTFCLNSPGHIHRYTVGGFSIPGGVVASPNVTSANVGILLRVHEKSALLEKIKSKATEHEETLRTESNRLHSGNSVNLAPVLAEVIGDKACIEIQSFVDQLNDVGLIDLNSAHRIHMPLIDWHWNTFALPYSHRTTLRNIFALGDSAGHARGLLQACMSGWLAAEEYLC